MADRVLSYHSSNPSDPDVYHVFRDCPSGQRIPPANKKPGDNGWRMCEHCRGMGG